RLWCGSSVTSKGFRPKTVKTASAFHWFTNEKAERSTSKANARNQTPGRGVRANQPAETTGGTQVGLGRTPDKRTRDTWPSRQSGVGAVPRRAGLSLTGERCALVRLSQRRGRALVASAAAVGRGAAGAEERAGVAAERLHAVFGA